MEVILRSTPKRVKKKIIRDHYWYDPETQKRIHGRGGRMIFVYDHTKKKQIPRIVDSEEWVHEPNYESILEWVKDNSSYVKSVTSKAFNHYVAIDVDANEFGNIEDELRLHGIMYDYDSEEFRKEVKDKRGKKKWQNSQSKWQTRLPH
jgi:hypothetical protein